MTLQKMFSCTWLPTGQVTRISAANISLAWQQAIEIYREEFIRELLPATYQSQEFGQVVAFSEIKACNYLEVQEVRQLKVSIRPVGWKGRTPINYFLEHDQSFNDLLAKIPYKLDILGHDIAFIEIIIPLLFSGALEYFCFKPKVKSEDSIGWVEFSLV